MLIDKIENSVQLCLERMVGGTVNVPVPFEVSNEVVAQYTGDVVIQSKGEMDDDAIRAEGLARAIYVERIKPSTEVAAQGGIEKAAVSPILVIKDTMLEIVKKDSIKIENELQVPIIGSLIETLVQQHNTESDFNRLQNTELALIGNSLKGIEKELPKKKQRVFDNVIKVILTLAILFLCFSTRAQAQELATLKRSINNVEAAVMYHANQIACVRILNNVGVQLAIPSCGGALTIQADTNITFTAMTGGFKISASGGGASPLTTKGDLYGYDTADARVPIGTDGKCLLADSTQALGLKWDTCPGGTPGGNNKEAQYNNAGVFGGASFVEYDSTWGVFSEPYHLYDGTVVFTSGPPNYLCAIESATTKHRCVNSANVTIGYVGDITGNSVTATALAVNPTDCAAGEYAIAIAANGNLTCAKTNSYVFELDAKNGNTNPVDSQTVYYGAGFSFGAITTYANRSIKVPATCTVRRVDYQWVVLTTNGSGETVNFYVRLNDTTDFANATGTLDTGATTPGTAVATGLSQTITAGDNIAGKLVFPVFATNPTAVRFVARIFCN